MKTHLKPTEQLQMELNTIKAKVAELDKILKGEIRKADVRAAFELAAQTLTNQAKAIELEIAKRGK